jgi:mitogen-activated protein kinase organizer 1
MDRANGELLQTYKHDAFVNKDLRVRSTLGLNDAVVVSGSDDGMVFAWDVVSGELLHQFKHSEMREVRNGVVSSGGLNSKKKDVVSAVAFCQARREWCSGGGDGNVVVWGMQR